MSRGTAVPLTPTKPAFPHRLCTSSADNFLFFSFTIRTGASARKRQLAHVLSLHGKDPIPPMAKQPPGLGNMRRALACRSTYGDSPPPPSLPLALFVVPGNKACTSSAAPLHTHVQPPPALPQPRVCCAAGPHNRAAHSHDLSADVQHHQSLFPTRGSSHRGRGDCVVVAFLGVPEDCGLLRLLSARGSGLAVWLFVEGIRLSMPTALAGG